MKSGSSVNFYAREWIVKTMGLTLQERGRVITEIAAAVISRDQDTLEVYRLVVGRAYWRAPQYRPTINPETRRVVFARDSYSCRQCGSSERLELDHVIPYSLGGAHSDDNFQTLCRRCNRSKGARV